MRQYGGPDVLRLERLPLAALRPDEIRVRSIASAVNHSDLEIRAGNWPILRADPFPYTPGLEVLGEVVEIGADVLEVRVGDRVITMMQGLGGVRAQRPGGYAEYVVVEASAVAAIDGDIDPIDMAALGLASVTAFEGLRRIAGGQWQEHGFPIRADIPGVLVIFSTRCKSVTNCANCGIKFCCTRGR